jgi:effector-binding domain-containing protein
MFYLVALEKIRTDFIKETQKSSDQSHESSGDESDYEKKSGARKKKIHSVPKKDQLIQTIYTGSYDTPDIPSLETAGGGGI